MWSRVAKLQLAKFLGDPLQNDAESQPQRNYGCTTLTLILSGLEINTWTNSSSASCVCLCGLEGEAISSWTCSSGACICPCWPLLTTLGTCTTSVQCLVCACCWSAGLTMSLLALLPWLRALTVAELSSGFNLRERVRNKEDPLESSVVAAISHHQLLIL